MPYPQLDDNEKVCVGGVDLMNRHELSNNQDRELQRFIDANSHLVRWIDEAKDVMKPVAQSSKTSAYSDRSRAISSEPTPLDRYNSMESLTTLKHQKKNEHLSDADLMHCPRPPSVDHANFTSDFPGIENISDNSYLMNFLDKMKSNENLNGNNQRVQNDSNSIAPYSSNTYSTIKSQSKTTNGCDEFAKEMTERSSSVPYNQVNRPASTTAHSDYGYLGERSCKFSHSPGSTLKRKGVSWLDLERARSFSPVSHHQPSNLEMSQYGSIGNLSFRDNAASPAYSSLGKHKDDYNRFETKNHARANRQKSPFEDSRFGGFGDRPGSGVELTSHQWNGGEIITDPVQMPKGLKPRRMYYSPIGDGTVAADGIELKRKPVDLSPKVTITQLQHMDRGDKGHGGVNVYEKSWSNSVGGDGRNSGFGSEYGPGSGRSSRAGAMSPLDKLGGNPNAGKAVNGPDNYGTGGNGGYPDNLSDGFGRGTPKNGFGSPSPHGNGGVGHGDGYPRYGGSGVDDGFPRGVTASPGIHDVNYKLDTKTGYLITNPRELIHQYATTTPVAVMNASDNTPSSTTVTKQSLYRRHEETTEEHFAPYAPYKSNSNVPSPNNFVKQLRNETLTQRQRDANQQIDPLNQKDPRSVERVQEISRSYSHTTRGGQDEIDALTNQLMSGLSSTTASSRY